MKRNLFLLLLLFSLSVFAMEDPTDESVPSTTMFSHYNLNANYGLAELHLKLTYNINGDLENYYGGNNIAIAEVAISDEVNNSSDFGIKTTVLYYNPNKNDEYPKGSLGYICSPKNERTAFVIINWDYKNGIDKGVSVIKIDATFPDQPRSSVFAAKLGKGIFESARKSGLTKVHH